MLSVEIRINGTLISAMTAINAGQDKEYSLGLYQYEVSGVMFPASGSGDLVTFTDVIKHKRSDGAEKLVELLMVAAAKGKKK